MSNNKASLSQDLTRALNLTLRPGRIVVLALGLLIGVAVAILFFWLGGLIKAPGLRWLGWIIQRIGAALFVYVVLASMSSAVAMAHAESAGEKIGVPAGWALITRNLAPVFFGTIKPIVVFVGLVAIIWLAGAFGAIPEVGPILWSIISIVPLAAGLLAIFIIVKLFLASFLFPVLLSVTKEKGITCYKESVRLIKGHAAHILGRVAVAVLICLVFYKVIVAGFAFTASQSAHTMGKNRATLRGSELLHYVLGVPGIAGGTAPRGLGVRNPAWPFREAGVTFAERYYREFLAPSMRYTTEVMVPWMKEKTSSVGEMDVEELVEQPAAPFPPKMKATQKIGGWIFSLVLIVVSTIVFSLPFLFFALSGYCAYLSFKDAPELPLRMPADWSEIKETAQEIAGKRKAEPAEKPGQGNSA